MVEGFTFCLLAIRRVAPVLIPWPFGPWNKGEEYLKYLKPSFSYNLYG